MAVNISKSSTDDPIPEHVKKLIRKAKAERSLDGFKGFVLGLAKVSKSQSEIQALKEVIDGKRSV